MAVTLRVTPPSFAIANRSIHPFLKPTPEWPRTIQVTHAFSTVSQPTEIPHSKPPVPTLDAPFTHLAAYRFAPLTDLRPLRERLQKHCADLDLKGTILVSQEGLNLFVAGLPASIAGLLDLIRTLPGFETFDGKYNPCDHQPYNRMLVRLKKEIISFGIDGIDPAHRTSTKLKPAELKQWLDEGRPVTLLDTRNDYEIKLGTFKNALTLPLAKFRDFPDAVRQLPPELKDQPIVMFCTGGIRCEKAGPFMEQEGFKHIYQLEGGILKYFEDCQSAHYDGECFVFDQRTGVDPSLHETDSTQCYHCQSPLTAADQADPRYIPGASCPHCHRPPEDARIAALAARRTALIAATTPLPGSIPYDNFRPLNVPATCDGFTLIEVLHRIVPKISPADWLIHWQENRLVDDEKRPLPIDVPLRAGQRILHRQPAIQEPDVNPAIDLLHEDEALIVLNKPAPLPMHPGGRFNRNTLDYILQQAFHPFKPRPAHRLDADTTGLVVFTKTKHFAGILQPQFTRGQIEKAYLARIHGHPETDTFDCHAPISDDPGRLGTRSIDESTGLPSHTRFHVLARHPDGTALVEAHPQTGRTHQIRLHLQHLGHPILGDTTYPAAPTTATTLTQQTTTLPLHLHSLRLTLTHPITQARVTYTTPAPSWAELTYSA